MPSSASSARSDVPHYGERGVPLAQAWQHGLVAVAELGFSARLDPLTTDEPGAWRCVLEQDGVPVTRGTGFGKGRRQAARVGAIFEALEHHLSAGMPPQTSVVLRGAHEAAAGELARDAACALLAEGPDVPIACLPYTPLPGHAGDEMLVPVFLSTPDYLHQEAAARAAAGDSYDYTALRRYSVTNGWAAGATPAEAMVHAINEVIERDAISILLIGQFLSPAPATLPVIDTGTLPAALAALHEEAERRLDRRVWLLEMTTDVGVPAYWAHSPATEPAVPSLLRGFGASLSACFAAEQALNELIQTHSGLRAASGEKGRRYVCTEAYPALHRCYLADFRIPRTARIPFSETPAPATPAEYLEALCETLHRAGFTPRVWQRHVSDHLSVLNVIIPGMERFMLVTSGQLVLPGPRGRTALTGLSPSSQTAGGGNGRVSDT
ncbi:YcaO-like family protein [Streptomyces sp. NBC_01497]|uniref:YcaO-like family protein n=1 Tax=Streptomyces sp. NBC_01497 TaxID=2903885 RepID=UPI002E2EEABD|nr:YcaO-like family protein [Streptomyces sp. NBC_01497]